jgi:hypothetical protein
MRAILFLLFTFLHYHLFAQDRIMFIDNCENFLTENKFEFKRIVKNDPEKKFQYIFSDYYKNGQLYTTGKVKAKNGNFKNGNFIFYHKNGTIMAEGQFENDQKVGNWKYWDSLGNEIVKDSLLLNLNETNITLDSINQRGKCFCYKRESTWLKKNILTNKINDYYYEDGNQIAINGIFSKVDPAPKYKDGLDSFYDFLIKNLKYPFITMLKGKHGKVFVKFIIDKNGNLKDPICLTSLDKQTDKKIKEALLLTKDNWIPAKYKGKNVGSFLILPLTFSLK